MNKTLLLTAAFIGLFVLACKKEVTTPNSGIYRGVFAEIDSTGDTLADGVLHLALFDEDQNFAMSGDTNTMAPATHGGTYTLDAAGFIVFDSYGDPQSLTQSQYDIDHYLDTAYKYSFDDVNFTLSLTKLGKTYVYDLVRD